MMKTPHEIPELDRKGLRQFGLVTGSIFAGLFGLIIPWLAGDTRPAWPLWPWPWPVWPWVVFTVLTVWSIVMPNGLRPVYRGWMWFGLQLSRITTPIILGIVFFVVIAPMGLLMRLVRGDPMARRFSSDVQSYRVQSKNSQQMEKPF